MRSDLGRQSVLRWAIAIVAAIWLLGGAAEHVWHAAVTVDSAHGSVSSAGGAVAVNADHTLCDCGLSPSCLVSVAGVDLPRWNMAFGFLAVLAAVAAVGCCLDRTQPSRRGPPRGPATPVTCQDLLTRFCLARR